MSSKKKKNASWGSIVCHAGKGTCQVFMPQDSAIGWKRNILRKIDTVNNSSVDQTMGYSRPEPPR